MKAEAETSSNNPESAAETQQTAPNSGFQLDDEEATALTMAAIAAPVIPPAKPSRRPLPTRVVDAINTAAHSLSLDERLGRIVLSIVLAILLWFYVTGLENPSQITSFRGMSLEVRSTEPNLKITNTSPLPTVDVSFQAPQSVLSTLSSKDIHPYIDLRGLSAGVHRVPVLVDFDGQLGSTLSNLSVTPPDVQVQLELQAARVFNVGVRVDGTPLFGYVTAQPQVDPSQVTVSGSESAITRIGSVIVPVDVDGKASTQRGVKSPVALDSSGQEITGLTFSPLTIQVTVPINLVLSNRLVPVRVPIVGNPAPGYSVDDIKIDPTNVTICCAASALLEAVQSVSTDPVSISGTTSTVITRTQIILPAGVELYPGQSRTITVTVSVRTFNTTWQLSVTPRVEGLPPGYSSVLSPNSIDLTLSGTFAQFQALRPDDVQSTIDGSTLGAGTYEITPTVTVPNDITLVSVNPAIITVSIIAPTPTPLPPTATIPPPPTATTAPTSTAVTVVPSPIPTASPGVPSPTRPASTPSPTHTPTIAPTAPPTFTAIPTASPTTTSQPPTASPAPPTATPTSEIP